MFNANGNNVFGQSDVFGQSGDNPAFDPGGPIGQEGYDDQARYDGQKRYDGGTSMVTGNDNQQEGQQEEVIVMQDVGPLRAWWEGLSPTTKVMFKAVGVGALIFAGKYAVEKAIDGIKKKGKEELIKESEDEDSEDEEIEGEE